MKKNVLFTIALLATVPVFAKKVAHEGTDSEQVAASSVAPDASADCSTQVAQDVKTEATGQPEISEEEFKKLIDDLIEKAKEEEAAKNNGQATQDETKADAQAVTAE